MCTSIFLLVFSFLPLILYNSPAPPTLIEFFPNQPFPFLPISHIIYTLYLVNSVFHSIVQVLEAGDNRVRDGYYGLLVDLFTARDGFEVRKSPFILPYLMQ